MMYTIPTTTVWFVPVITGLFFLLGHVLHEATHAITAIAAGGSIEAIGWQSVTFRTGEDCECADNLVHAAPVIAWVPHVGVVAYLTSTAGFAWIYGLAILIGYMPRSESDWNGARELFS